MFGLFGKPRTVQDVAKPYTDRIDAAANVPEMRQQAAQAPRQDDFRINPTLAAIGQIFSGMAGRSNPVFEMLMTQRLQQQRAQQQARQAEAKRGAEWDDWQRREQWKREHPAPVRNDTVDDFNWYKGLSPQDRGIYDQMHPVVIDGPDGRYLVPRSSFQGQAGIPTAPVGKLTPIGGPAPGAPGGFPR